MTNSTSRALLGLIILVALSACGGGADDPDPQSPGPSQQTADPAPQAGVEWADGVCEATSDLQASIDTLGTSLEVDLGSVSEVSDQVREQVSGQVDVIVEDVSTVAGAIAAVPDGADPDVATASAELQANQQILQESADDLRSDAAGLTESDDPASLLAALGAVTTDLGTTRSSFMQFVDSLRDVASAGSAAAQAAFADAPACADLQLEG